MKTRRRYHSSNQNRRPYFFDKMLSIIHSPISTVHIHHDFHRFINFNNLLIHQFIHSLIHPPITSSIHLYFDLTHCSFLNVVDLLNVGLSEVKDRQIWLERFLPNLWNHKICQTLRIVVQVRPRFVKRRKETNRLSK